MSGAEDIIKLREKGATEVEIAAWEQNRRSQLQAKGATAEEIDDYFGVGPIDFEADDKGVRTRIAEAKAPTAEGGEVKDVTFLEALDLGFQGSISGLAKSGKLPEKQLSRAASLWDKITVAVGQVVGDAPVSIPAFFAGVGPGAAVGAAAGGPFAPFTGAAGGLIGGGAVSGAATEATRAGLIEMYRRNKYATAEDYAVGIASSVLREGGKGGLIGAVSSAGGVVARPFAAPIGNAAVRHFAIGAAEMTSATLAASAIAGELADRDEFIVGLAIGGGVALGAGVKHAASADFRAMSDRLQNIYVRTGARPAQVLSTVETDAIVRQEVVAGDGVPPGPGVKAEKVAFTDGDNVAGEEVLHLPPASTTESGGPTLWTRIVNAARPGGPRPPSAAPVAAAAGGTPPPGGAAPPAAAAAAPPPGGGPTPPAGAGSLAGARQSILGRVTTKEPRRSWRQWIDDVRYDYINDLQYAVSEAAQAWRAETGRRLSVEENPGELMRLAAGAHSKAEVALKRQTSDPTTGRRTGDGLQTIMERVPKTERTNLMAYLISKRVLEKEGQGLPTGFNVTDAQTIVNSGNGDARFVRAFRELQDWTDNGIDTLVHAGVLDADGAAQIRAMNQAYLPFNRLMDDATTDFVSTRGLPVRNPVKGFEGSARKIFDPLETLVKNRYALQQIAENNLARRRMIDFNNTLSPQNQFIHRAAKQTTVIELSEHDTNLANFLRANGIAADQVNGVLVYRAMQSRLAKGQFIVFENGKPVVYEASEPKLAMSMQALDRSTQSLLTKILAVPASTFRTGTVLAPDFALRAIMKDTLGAFIQNPFRVVPVVDSVIGIAHLIGRTDSMVRWINDGGANSALFDMDKRVFKSGIYDGSATKGIIGRTWNVVTKPFQWLAAGTTLLENATRLGQDIRSRRAGVSAEVAGIRSRDVTLDFSRMGARVRAWNAISAFVGPTINGIDRTINAFHTNPAATTMKAMAAVTLPSLLLWYDNKDQQWYKDLDEWEKYAFWHINVGTDSNPTIARIPMPPQFGVLFGGIPVAVMESYVNDNPAALRDLQKALVDEFSIDPLPTAITPLIEIGANHNFYSNSPLVSSRLEGFLPPYRYTPYTSETSKRLAQMMQTAAGGIIPGRFRSPIAIDHIIRNWSGTLGTVAVRLVDRGLNLAPERVDPALSWTEQPFTKGFFSRYPQYSKQLDDFFTNADLADQALATMKEMQLQGRDDEADKIEDEYGHIMLKTARTRKAISNLLSTIRGAYYDNDIDEDEKRQLLDDYSFEIIEIATYFNEDFEDAKKNK